MSFNKNKNLHIGWVVQYSYSSEHVGGDSWKVSGKAEAFGSYSCKQTVWNYEITNKETGEVVRWVQRKDLTHKSDAPLAPVKRIKGDPLPDAFMKFLNFGG